MQREVWLIPIVDERMGVQVKLWDSLSASEVVFNEDVLYEVYAPLSFYLW